MKFVVIRKEKKRKMQKETFKCNLSIITNNILYFSLPFCHINFIMYLIINFIIKLN